MLKLEKHESAQGYLLYELWDDTQTNYKLAQGIICGLQSVFRNLEKTYIYIDDLSGRNDIDFSIEIKTGGRDAETIEKTLADAVTMANMFAD